MTTPRSIPVSPLAGICLHLILTSTMMTSAADWPMWRADAARRGSSPAGLPEKLHLQWVLELPEPAPAWPSTQDKLQFDRLYEPVVLGRRMFVPSMISDKVTAFDTRTGEELWSTYTDGPVRFACVARRDGKGDEKVYFTSDDGYLHCVDAASGKPIWKFRGGPNDRKVIGNHRLVNMWPARGGPVLYEDTIYFGASIWPFMGIFLHALDADTGEVRWSNTGTGSSYLTQQHNSPAFAGIAPQGYIAATKDSLVISGGRTLPAVFDRATGRFRHFNLASRKMGSKGGGGFDVVVGENFYINRGAMYRLDNGHFVQKLDALLINEHAIVCHDAEGIRGYRPRWIEQVTKDRKGKVTKKVIAKKSWTTPVDEKVQRVFIQAGDRLYCTGENNTLLAVEISNLFAGAKATWSTQIPDAAMNMIAADDRLIVSTGNGRVYCFGGDEPGTPVALPRPAGTSQKIEPTLVATGATWRYRDDGEDPGASWIAVDFDDSAWPQGKSKLGYGDDDNATELEFGKDKNSKPLTCYFRKAFELPAGGKVESVDFRLRVDDGAVVYLNGQEAARLRMPQGAIGNDTAATDGPADEKTFDTVKIDPALLRESDNVLAISVHQRSTTSSDLALDAELVARLTPDPRVELRFAEDSWTVSTTSMLAQAGSRVGYAYVLGLGNGRLAEELIVQSDLHVVVLDPDVGKVDAFRRRMDRLGLYGRRVVACVCDPLKVGLPQYSAELIACADATVLGEPDRETVLTIFDVLRPFSGVACLATTGPGGSAFLEAAKESPLPGGTVETLGGLVVLRRIEAPEGSADWTHQYGDAGNTATSRDTRVRAPLGLLWFGGPSTAGVLPRHGHGPTPQVVRGQLYIEGRDMMRAVDIYTGRLVWERQLKDVGKDYDYTSHEPGANILGSNYVSVADGVHVVYEDRCLRLDPATGKTIATIELPRAEGQKDPTPWGFIGAWKGYLLAGAQPTRLGFVGFRAADVKGIKDKALKEAIDRFKTLKNFKIDKKRPKQDDHQYLTVGLNQLLLDDDMVARIPDAVRTKAKTADTEKQLADYLEKIPGRTPQDPDALVIKRKLLNKWYGLPDFKSNPRGKFGTLAGSGSGKLVVLDRHTGEALWETAAKNNIRHNTIVAGNDKVFFVDRISDSVAKFLRRRGRAVNDDAAVVAFDIASGKELWRVTDRVFGTWLGYSAEEDILLQAGSKFRDRASDEVGKGMVAYRGATGEVIWENNDTYEGPCIILGKTLMTQGHSTPGYALDLLTGARIRREHPVSRVETDWLYTRTYGCNNAIGAPNLLTFRSAAAGYYDLLGNSGTGNLGGFRSGCTASLIPAGGILNAPDYTRTCTCSYQNQASLGLVHMPEAEMWTFSPHAHDNHPVQSLGLNFGAPGDRRGPNGTFWLDYPSTGGKSPDVHVDARIDRVEYLRHHTSRICEGDLRWVAASAVKGSGDLAVRVVSRREFVIANEVRGGAELKVSHGAESFDVPGDSVPGTGARNISSLRKGPGKSNLSAVLKGDPRLSPESVTAELWVKVDGDLDYVDARVGGKDSRHGFVFDNRKPRARYFVANEKGDDNGKVVTIEAKDAIPTGAWVHLAFTYDAQTGVGTIWRDGKSVARHDGPDGRPLWWDREDPEYRVGKDSASEKSHLDELRLTSRALRPKAFLHATGAKISSGALIGYWRMSNQPATGDDEASLHRVRLVFAEIEGLAAGERVFDVSLQGRKVLSDFDIAREAGGENRAIVRQFDSVPIRGDLRVRIESKRGAPALLGGLEIVRTLGRPRDF